MASNNKAFVRDVKKFLKRNSMILVALFILVVALSIFTNTFLTKDNLLSVVRQCSVEAVLAFGMALVLIIGCIDLSVSSVVALSGCICVYLIEISGFPTEVAVLLTLLFGAYVEVTAKFDTDGIMMPVSFIWEDGTVYQIDRIKAKERCASRKAGGTGIMYTVMVDGKECHLFYEFDKWFMERR